MPITREEFQEGKPAPTMEERVLSFLAADEDHAYDAMEILHAVAPRIGLLFLEDIVHAMLMVEALDHLVRQGLVKIALVNGQLYYMIDNR